MINRRYKDTVFRDLFGAPERRAYALSLYNALNGSGYDDPAELELTTLDDVLYMGVKNDVSLLIGDDMALWEHQSTRNPNMPLRGLVYFGRLLSAYVDLNGLNPYGTRLVRVPTPHYVVFYIGREDQPDSAELRLSDAFAGGPGDVEVVAHVINVNAGHSGELLGACEPLAGYARFVGLAREGERTMGMERAVEAAIDRCIEEGVLADYFRERRAQVVDMFMTEYDQEVAMEYFRAEGRAEGVERGVSASARALMETMGLTARQALDALRVPEDERARYLALL